MKKFLATILAAVAVTLGFASVANAEAIPRPVAVTPVATQDPAQLAAYGAGGAAVGALTGAAVGVIIGGVTGCLIGAVACPVTAPVGAAVGLVAGAAIGATILGIEAVHEAQTYQP